MAGSLWAPTTFGTRSTRRRAASKHQTCREQCAATWKCGCILAVSAAGRRVHSLWHLCSGASPAAAGAVRNGALAHAALAEAHKLSIVSDLPPPQQERFASASDGLQSPKKTARACCWVRRFQVSEPFCSLLRGSRTHCVARSALPKLLHLFNAHSFFSTQDSGREERSISWLQNEKRFGFFWPCWLSTALEALLARRC